MMIICVDQLYYQFLCREEHDMLIKAMAEFSETVMQFRIGLPDFVKINLLEKTSLHWVVVVNEDTGVTTDYHSVEFTFSKNFKVNFPIISTSEITALSLFVLYLKALSQSKLPALEVQS